MGETEGPGGSAGHGAAWDGTGAILAEGQGAAHAETTDASAPGMARKLGLLAVVVLPIVGLAWGIVELWNQWVTWRDLVLFGVFYAATTLGISIGFHRMLAHGGLKAPRPVRWFFLVLGSMALEGPPRDWAANHVKHHAHSDRPGDPHSPVEGFWHAHVGWLFSRGQSVEERFRRPFRSDPVVEAVSRTLWVWAGLGFVLPAAIGYVWAGWAGAWGGLLWGGVVRVFFNHHVTWSVNSVCHTFGRRSFPTPDRSRNEWVVGLLAFGEGWHNNHHAFPRSAVHGLRWYQFDLSGWLIRGMQRLGVVRDVYIVPKERWKARMGAR